GRWRAGIELERTLDRGLDLAARVGERPVRIERRQHERARQAAVCAHERRVDLDRLAILGDGALQAVYGELALQVPAEQEGFKCLGRRFLLTSLYRRSEEHT